MSGNLIQIGRSGAAVARSALEATAQNIANADNPDYARRSLSIAEVAATGGIGLNSSAALSGARVDRVLRTQSQFLHTELRRTNGDAARADAELTGLRSAEAAIEQSGLHSAITQFEGSLAQLTADPLDGALRASAFEAARSLTQTFSLASQGLDAAREGLLSGATFGVEQVNILARELARTNLGLARAQDGSMSKATLLDQRDAMLKQMSELVGTTTEIDPVGRATVRLGSGGAALVDGAQVATLTMAQNADTTVSFALDGAVVTPTAGSLTGQASAIARIRDLHIELDGSAALLIQQGNDAQSNGVTPAGTQGQPLFSGTGAASIQLALANGSGFATASSGSGPNSRSTGNLEALRATLAGNGPAAATDRILYDLSSAIYGRETTRDALRIIADTAEYALIAETGVDLDNEAANLLRFQQAFQANSRVIQTAADIFDTLLGIG